MTNIEKAELQLEIECAELMVKDLKKLWSSYAKKALQAKIEREERQARKHFREYETEEELVDAYGWGSISDSAYREGLAYFESLKNPPPLSCVEQHRNNIKRLLEQWQGTLKELNNELNLPCEKHEMNAFEKRELEERQERYDALRMRDLNV